MRRLAWQRTERGEGKLQHTKERGKAVEDKSRTETQGKKLDKYKLS